MKATNLESLALHTKVGKPGTASPNKRKNMALRLKELGLGGKEERIIELESPTSNSMKNCFLIKNAHPSFEKRHQQIKKRAIEFERTGSSPNNYDQSLTKTSGKRPPARDGHSGMIFGNNFFIFGGDRHHMPFNDFHMLDLNSEF
jgi:hypothetical protein